MTDEERSTWHEPFFDTFVHYDAHVAELPPLPPAHASAPSEEDEVFNSLAAVGDCTLGGILWGAARGALRSSRARRSVSRSALLTALGATIFEGAMQIKVNARARTRLPRAEPRRARPKRRDALTGSYRA